MRDMMGIIGFHCSIHKKRQKQEAKYNQSTRQAQQAHFGVVDSIDSPCDCIYSICPNTNEQPHRRAERSKARQLLSLFIFAVQFGVA